MNIPLSDSNSFLSALSAAFLAGATVLTSLLFAAAPAQAVDVFPQDLKIETNGQIQWQGVRFYAAHFSQDWKRVTQQQQRRAKGYPQIGDDSWLSQGMMNPPTAGGSPIFLKQEVRVIGTNALRMSYAASSKEGTPTQEMFLQIDIPFAIGKGRDLLLDGKAHPLPENFGERLLLSKRNNGKPATLVIPAHNGSITLHGVFSIVAQDQREYKKDAGFGIRLRFSPEQPVLHEAELKVDASYKPFTSTPVSIRSVANFGLKDAVANDKKGGWTDQGPDNDISALPTGMLNAANVSFEIIDEKTNNGRAAIVLGRKVDTHLPDSVTVDVTGAPVWKNIYLLHAIAWPAPVGTTIGQLVATYADGSTSEYDIRSGKEAANWWAPAQLENGAVGWVGRNLSNQIGLYVSTFALEAKPLRSLTLYNAGTSMWMVAGLSGSGDDITVLAQDIPWEAQAGGRWAVHNHEIEIEEGSVFDFSRRLDAPAGKHGWVIATPEGKLAFANQPEEPVRFWGVNLTFSANYLEKDEVDRLAKRLARSGYNTIRIHHYDRIIRKKNAKSYELDPEMLDKLDYLFAAMKREGLYINLDLYTSRSFSQEELVQMGFAKDMNDEVSTSDIHSRFKAALPVLEDGFEIWAAFARNLLTHKNPYTGLTWGEDPALFGICPVNENSPSHRVDSEPMVKALFEKAFEKWWADPANQRKADGNRETGFNTFVYEAHSNLDARIYAFLKNEMGVKALLTGSNYLQTQGLAFSRAAYDFVDNHQYWDHPTFPERRWQLPFRYTQQQPTTNAARTPRQMMPTRIIGKPFSVTEFNFIRPNRHRAEGGVLMPAYASLQDWSSMHNYTYSGSRKTVLNPDVIEPFSVVTDPIGIIADRLSAVIFLRGDIAPAQSMIGFEVRPESAFSSRNRPFPEPFNRLGLVTRIGSKVPVDGAPAFAEGEVAAIVVNPEDTALNPAAYAGDRDLHAKLKDAGVIAEDAILEKEGIYRSETGEIEMNTEAGTVSVVTDLSELFILPAAAELSGDFAHVRNGDTFGTVSIISADDLPLASSRRLLVAHLTNAMPTGARFGDADGRLMTASGVLPYLIERGSAEITLQLDSGLDWQAWAVAPTGRRIAQVPLTKTDKGWVLKAQTVSGDSTRLAYEIAPR